MSGDKRTQVLLGLLPPGAVFLHCYSDDSLWWPDCRGYVNERDPSEQRVTARAGHRE